MHHALATCELFETLNEVVDESRALWGRKLQLLILKPLGAFPIVYDRQALTLLFRELIGKATLTGSNSVCFSAVKRNDEIWLRMTDNGWTFNEVRMRFKLTEKVHAQDFASGTQMRERNKDKVLPSYL